MKKILVCLFVASLLFSCKNNTTPETITVDTTSETTNSKEKEVALNTTKAEFTIEGMTCAVGCAATIQKNLNKMEGVANAKVDFEKKLAMVSYDEAKVDLKDLEKTVLATADIYKVSDMKKVDSFSKSE